MTKFNICLANPFKLKYRWQTICEEVYELFIPSIGMSAQIESLRVFSTKTKPSLQPTDVIVYVVASQDMDVVARHFSMWDKEAEMGVTGFDRPNETASEVYLNTEMEGERYEPRFLAKSIWHEIGHNKSQMGDAAFHSSDGLRVDFMRSYTQLTETNKTFMAGVLPNANPQWTGGFDFD